jgi:hypothetical protein
MQTIEEESTQREPGHVTKIKAGGSWGFLQDYEGNEVFWMHKRVRGGKRLVDGQIVKFVRVKIHGRSDEAIDIEVIA